MNTDEQPAGAPADLLAAAAAIDGAAAGLDQAAPGADPAAAPAGPVVVDWHAEAKDLIDFAAELTFPIWPRLAQVWEPKKLEQLTTRLSRVMQKWDLTSERLGKWAPEIMLAVTLVPAVIPTVQAIRQDNAEARAKAEEQGRAAPPAGQVAAPPPKQAPRPPGETPPPAPDALKLHEAV